MQILEREKTIRRYLNNLEKLRRLPLITDAEMTDLFGQEVQDCIAKLSGYDTDNGRCHDYQKRCCLVAGCELYDAKFDRCPIYEYRPVVCRLHYCHLFQKEQGLLVEELSNVFFDCLLAAQAAGMSNVILFDSPPLIRCAPSLVTAVRPLVNKLKSGQISKTNAIDRIQQIAAQFEREQPRNQG